MSRWYRAYEGTVSDAKLGEVALVAGCSRSVAIAAWHCILESACTLNEGGKFKATSRNVAVTLQEQPATIEAVFKELESLEMIKNGHVLNWSKRQYQSDNSTERSKKHRENKRSIKSNGDATLQKQDATVPDTDTDTDRGDKSPLRGGDGFGEFLEAYPKRSGIADEGAAKLAYYATTIDTPPETILAAATSYAAWCKANGKTNTQYVKQAKTWLSNGLWREWDIKTPPLISLGVLVRRGTPAWDAWQAVKKTPCSERLDGWHFPTETPPTQDKAA